MLIPALLILFAAAANCEEYGWKSGKSYEYDLNMCMSDSKDAVETIGSFVKADLNIRPFSDEKLSVTIQHKRHRVIVNAEETERCPTFPSDELNFKNKNFSSEPFEINLKQGIVTILNVGQDVTNSELDLIKVITSLLQLDLQGKNCKGPKPCQIPTETKPKAVYNSTENLYPGVCETHYEVSPLSENDHHIKLSSKKPASGLDNGKLIEVVKTVDHMKCQQNSADGGSDNFFADKFDSINNTNRAIISGSVRHYVIRSIVSITKMYRPTGTGVNVVNLTLTSAHPANGHPRNISNPRAVSLTMFMD